MPPFDARVLLSQRTSHLREAGLLRQLTLKVNALPDGINLGQGVCDLDMPEALRDAAIASIRRDRATYTPFPGIQELREAIASRTRARYGLDYGAEGICVTVGASAAFAATLFTLIDPGDELVLFEPFYPYHLSLAKLAGAVVRTLPIGRDGAVPFEALKGILGPKTKLVVVNTPSNPIGKVWSRRELEALSDLLAPTKTMVVTDEIYEDLCFDGRTHVPPATVPGLFDRTVTISGLSKAYSITGWRLGWIAAPEAITRAIGPVFDIMCVCAPRPFQHAAVEALRTLPESWYGGQRDAYARRRTLLADALRAGGFVPRIPEGAYYMAADYSGVFGDLSPRDACFALLDRFHIGAIPSDLFHADASGATPFLRFQFAVEEPVLREVERRMARGGV